MTRASLAAVAATLLVGAGCGDGSGGDPEPPTGSLPAPVTAPPPADSTIAQGALIGVSDLGPGWLDGGPLQLPAASPCPIAAEEALPATSRAVSRRFLEERPPEGAATASVIQQVFVLPTLAAAADAFAGHSQSSFLTCVRDRLATALEAALPAGSTVDRTAWQPVEWPVTGDATTALGVDLPLHSKAAGTPTSAAFLSIVARQGRAITVLELSWLRPDLDQQDLVRALRAAVDRLAPARVAPDDRAA